MDKLVNNAALRCVLTGGSSLLGACGDELRKRGHVVVAVIGDDATAAGLPWFATIEEAMQSLEERPDLLISIVNRRLLVERHLEWARMAAVNYHDSLLPRYAGVNAPSWAILNGETEHGITWHQMAARLDSGDILVQRAFALAGDETALSLNAKCYEHAIAGFQELVQNLERGMNGGRPQDLKRRTMYSAHQRLPAQGIISWQASVMDIDRAVRASFFGPYPNDFGRAKVLLPDDALCLVKSCCADTTRRSVPGTVLHVSRTGLCVAAADGVIHLQMEEGGPGFANLAGQVLPGIDDNQKAHIEQAECAAARIEPLWCGRLRALPPPLTMPQLKPGKHPPGLDHVVVIDAPWTGNEALAAMLVHLSVISGMRRFAVALAGPAPIGFAVFTPVIVEFPEAEPATFDGHMRAASQAVSSATSMPPFPLDLTARFPALQAAEQRLAQITVVLGEAPTFPAVSPGLCVVTDEGGLQLRFSAGMISHDEARTFARRARAWLNDSGRSMAAAPSAEPAGWVHELIMVQARLRPDKVAVEMGDETVTYAQLEDRAGCLAGVLQRQGAVPESRVGILMERSVSFVVCVLAVLKAGAAYVPLDVDMPLARLKQIAEDAGLLLIVSSDAARDTAGKLGVPVMGMDATTNARSEAPGVARPVAVHSDTLAYIIYTSGSSGRPKGSMIEHGALRHFIGEDVRAHGIHDGDRILQLCAITFDASVEEMFSALVAGATLVLRHKRLLDSARHFLDGCESARITVAGIFAAMLGGVLAEMERGGRFPTSVRLVTTGGERVVAGDVRRWQRFFRDRSIPAPRLVNVYGLTETTVANLLCDLSLESLDDDVVPIGQPLPGNVARVVSEHLLDLPAGEAGELLLGGVQLARGYLNRPGLDAGRFILAADGTRWFRTGDEVRQLPDGQFEFLGRLDRQVKRGGFRIELEDVEQAIRDQGEVLHAAVVQHDGSGTGERLIAFVSPANAGLEDRLLNHLRTVLPAYMRPNEIRLLEVMPLNRHGKIDRDALAVLAQPANASAKEGTRDPIAGIWARMLPSGCEAVFGRTFFELGGDSLLALRLFLQVEEVTGAHIPLSSFFQDPTLEGLQRMIAGAECAESSLIVVLQAGDGIRPPIYCLPGLHGDVNEYVAFASSCPDDQAVFGVRSPLLLHPDRKTGSLEEAAGELRAAIRRHRPAPAPLVLFGACWSGWLAFEIARQCLQEEGVAPVVIMLDSSPPDLACGFWEMAAHFLRWLPRWCWQRLSKPERLRATIANLVRVPVEAAEPEWQAQPSVKRFLYLSDHYSPERVAGLSLHLLRATPWQPHPLHWFQPRRLHDNGWQRWTGCKTEVYDVPGDHSTLMTPATMTSVTRVIREILEKQVCLVHARGDDVRTLRE